MLKKVFFIINVGVLFVALAQGMQEGALRIKGFSKKQKPLLSIAANNNKFMCFKNGSIYFAREYHEFFATPENEVTITDSSSEIARIGQSLKEFVTATYPNQEDFDFLITKYDKDHNTEHIAQDHAAKLLVIAEKLARAN